MWSRVNAEDMLLLQILLSFVALAEPRVGRAAAAKYFNRAPATSTASSGEDVLWLHFGRGSSSQAYNWGEKGKVEGVATNTYGLSYLMGDWLAMDGVLRADFNEFEVAGVRTMKMSLLPTLVLPRASTRFPIYFGLGAGLGIFFQQVENKSQISFDYQLFTGLRLMDLAPGFGGFVEFGMKNHVHVLSEGQLNGTYLSLGPIFNF